MPEKKAAGKALVPQVLVLEDEPVISKMLDRTLKAAGMEADIADNGLLAMDKIKSGKAYDLFVLDIRTPIVSGIQLYEFLEKNSPKMVDKVIFMTGDYLNGVTYTFLERVNRPFINKPFTPDQMMDLIRRVLQQVFISI